MQILCLCSHLNDRDMGSMAMSHSFEGKRVSLKAKVFFELICKANLKHKGQ